MLSAYVISAHPLLACNRVRSSTRPGHPIRAPPLLLCGSCALGPHAQVLTRDQPFITAGCSIGSVQLTAVIKYLALDENTPPPSPRGTFSLTCHSACLHICTGASQWRASHNQKAELLSRSSPAWPVLAPRPVLPPSIISEKLQSPHVSCGGAVERSN